ARIAQAADKRREEIANSAGEDPVAAALARIKAKKAEAQTAEPVQAKANGEPDNSELMAQRRARRLAKQAEVKNEVNDNLSINTVQQVEE
ncbi:electron transport complex subunit RsxC, partial [Xanthomonas citri pv. citri]|nr:electron transport complex subunit RsxC [Xanthomonas citri pv. citri]